MSSIVDPRITESSSLAISARFPGIAYTANDEGKAVVYAIDIASGETVGTTKLKKVPFVDPEAMAVDPQGTLWLADVGDNKKRRSSVVIHAFPEPGPGNHKVTPAYSWPADQFAELLDRAGLVTFARLLHDPASERGFLDAHLLARLR